MADVVLDCGCSAVVTHTRGDRRIPCHRHRRHFIVSAADTAIYTTRPLPDDDGPAAA